MGSGSCAERLYNLSYIGFSYPAKDAAVLKQVECLIKMRCILETGKTEVKLKIFHATHYFQTK
ncbi:hypothetical protein D7X48_19480 [bacterium D16-50]|nr:hypothetical protein D7X48_19480 [bacterium D16-50]